MSKSSGLGLLFIGLVIVVLGVLIQSAIIEWLLDVAGWIAIIGGAVIAIIGLVRMFTGGGSSGY